MGLQAEIERFFRESQTWDLEMLARSALPSYHSNYPTSPLPPGASGGINTSATVTLEPGGGPNLWLTTDKDYFQMYKVVLYLVDDNEIEKIGDNRHNYLLTHGNPNEDFSDHVQKAKVAKAAAAAATTAPAKAAAEKQAEEEFAEARGHLQDEGQNFRIAIDLYEFPPAGGKAKKVLIRFDNCHYILKSYVGQKDVLEADHGLVIPPPGFAARWPEWIEIRTAKNAAGDEYKRADLA